MGGIIGFIMSRNHEAKLDRAERIELENFHNPENLFIPGIKDTSLKNEYLAFERDTTYPKKVTFKIGGIKTNETLYALDWTNDSSLVLVARENSKQTMGDGAYHELWVWSRYVKRKTHHNTK